MSVNEEMTALADAIRGKTGLTGLLSIAEMTQAVKAMQSVITDTVRGRIIGLTYSAETKLLGLRIFGETTQDGTPTPDAPVELESVGNDGNLEVVLSGKNLLLDDIAGTYTGNNTTMEIVPDMRIAGGFVPNIRYTLSLKYTAKDIVTTSAGNLLYFKISYTDGTDDYYGLTDTSAGYFSYVSPPGKTLRKIAFTRHNRWTGGTITITQVQIEMGTSATDWEARKEIQTLSVPTPNGLPGIPVTSGGNYTDENGQQWICDEVDFDRGVHIQRVFQIPLDVNVFTNFPDHSVRTVAGRSTITFNNVPSIAGANNSGQPGTVMLSNFSNIIGSGAVGACVMWENGTSGIMQCNIAFDTQYVAEATKEAFIDFFRENPGKILIGMPEPIETPLSVEEMAAYDALHTYYPNTTIYNDANAMMEASFVVDTKTYIDNQVAALSAAMIDM